MHYKQDLVIVILQFLETLSVFFIFFSSLYFCNTFQFPTFDYFSNQLFTVHTFIVFVFIAFLWNRFFWYMGLYNFRFYERRIYRLLKVASCTLLASFIFYWTMYALFIRSNYTFFPYLFILSTVCFFLLLRIIILYVVIFLREHKRNLKIVAIVGINDRSISFSKFISSASMGMHVIAFLDDSTDRFNMIKEKNSNLIVAKLDKLNRILAEHPIDEVVIFLPVTSFYNKICSIVDKCKKQGIKARYINDAFDIHDGKLFVDMVHDDNIPYIDFEKNRFPPVLLDCKRFCDIVISSVLIFFTLPLMLIIALLIYIDDGKPIFFIQKRVGKQKKLFNMYKFRSMVKNAEKLQEGLESHNEISGAAFKITNDPRISRLGAFLRKTSLDELPQFFNVLIGNMSLVGPRPLPVRDYQRFYKNTHRRRFSIKPGITGLWQISGRNDVDFEQWMELDLLYIDTWSFWLDFAILLRTVPAVLLQKGAK